MIRSLIIIAKLRGWNSFGWLVASARYIESFDDNWLPFSDFWVLSEEGADISRYDYRGMMMTPSRVSYYRRPRAFAGYAMSDEVISRHGRGLVCYFPQLFRYIRAILPAFGRTVELYSRLRFIGLHLMSRLMLDGAISSQHFIETSIARWPSLFLCKLGFPRNFDADADYLGRPAHDVLPELFPHASTPYFSAHGMAVLWPLSDWFDLRCYLKNSHGHTPAGRRYIDIWFNDTAASFWFSTFGYILLRALPCYMRVNELRLREARHISAWLMAYFL